MKTEFINFVREIWALVRPYWRSEDRWAGFALLAVIVALNLGMVYLNVLFNQWNNTFYDALQNHNVTAFWAQLLRFCWLAAAFILVAVYQLYLNQMLQIRWRRWLTEEYLSDWMRNRVYYGLQLRGSTDNPDQRISDDLRLFVEQTLNLSLGLMSSMVTLGSFILILWGLSGVIRVPLDGHVFHLYGSMVWAGLFYAVVGTWLTHRVGRPLIGLNFDQQRYEADFRFDLVRFRENAESIALYRGEHGEQARFKNRFSWVVGNWWAIMRRQKRLTFFTAGYNQIATVYPFLVAAPRYLAGNFTLGQLMQTASAFGQVQASLSFIVNSYTDIAEWRAVTQRLTGFRRALEQVYAASRTAGGVRFKSADRPSLRLNGVDVAKPNGEMLVENVHLTVAPGERVLLVGPSGCGKSSLFRTIAGIWPFAHGEIRKPESGETLFLPQAPYLPIGPLRMVVTYSATKQTVSDKEIVAALENVGLGSLAERLDESAHWSQRLSPGEQQRIAFARALLIQPAWLFMDEATSALDEDAERSLYQLLKSVLPQTSILSIGHRSTLIALHDRVVDMRALADNLRHERETEVEDVESPGFYQPLGDT